ncbi:helix-hairpin-helix domain-containing protein [Endozoicomonas sp. SM1973]|uniref:Helix-hairpin-helix domain-containing protein n=1 Tax=Spartinivicinus marinus TaxID=2994442 RepID=A0A853HXJ0_9GAMM|nr:helix-hairpin-helix domain-containing protein [Spartinivicinus marinus]NYZ65943.1 helix-hairpin-helix domain-containing protein [Spartinivicinus marinus]
MKNLLKSLTLAISVLMASFSWASANEVNINTADAVTIAEVLTGVGEAKAKAIIAYRDEHGDFTSIEQLLEVKGIGEGTLNKNEGKIVVK